MALDLDAELSAGHANLRRLCDIAIAEYEELLASETNQYFREFLSESSRRLGPGAQGMN
jgi:hypothetical protein